MNSDTILNFAAAGFSSVVALAGILRKRVSLASWCFFVGMIGLAAESVLGGLSFSEVMPEKVRFWQILALVTKSFVPAVWLSFSLVYSRGNYREFLYRWRLLLVAAFLAPVLFLTGFRQDLLQVLPQAGGDGWWVSFGLAAKVLNGLLLIEVVLILMNLERTFRAAVGTMQWRIKFLVLGLGVVFGARIYTRSQILLFSGHTLALTGIETGALLLGCILIGIGYLRSGFGEIDVYPSRAVLHTSLTVLLAGGYLFIVGVFAQIVAHTGGSRSFQIQAFLVLVGIVILAVLLLSDRFRQRFQSLVSHHFKRPRYDFRQIWTRFARSTSSAVDPSSLCAAAAKLISETFNVLSVTFWLFDEENERLTFGASTSQSEREVGDSSVSFRVGSLTELRKPFDLEKVKADWAAILRQISATHFSEGGNRFCVPLCAGDRSLGVAILADRVSGVPYTMEELDLLKCIGDQIAASLLNSRLAEEIMAGKELEAFQTITAFFVHDLKNAASTLSLTLENLPVHFDDPQFRQDALRGISATVDRINQLIGRVSVLRHKVELNPVEFDLNRLVNEALGNLNGVAGVEVVKDLQPLPKLMADREQLHSVVTNLLLNAREAVGAGGTVTVETSEQEGWAALSVADNGCGMTPAFLKNSLFRPFQTTKKKGLGIGMFQSKMIVEAHRGNIQVRSELGAGTTFLVMLPLKLHAE